MIGIMWDIKHNKDLGIIEITYTGDVTALDLREATLKRISMQEETGTNLVLSDASRCNSGPSIIDLYDLPDKIYTDHKARRSTRIAFIPPMIRESSELTRFFENAAKNRGWTIEIFKDRKNALSWLKKMLIRKSCREWAIHKKLNNS